MAQQRRTIRIDYDHGLYLRNSVAVMVPWLWCATDLLPCSSMIVRCNMRVVCTSSDALDKSDKKEDGKEGRNKEMQR
jgi:hypothetical protein